MELFSDSQETGMVNEPNLLDTYHANPDIFFVRHECDFSGFCDFAFTCADYRLSYSGRR